MAEFEPLQGGGGSPPAAKKKFKFDKKKMILFGGLAIAAFVLISALFRRPQDEAQSIPGDGGITGLPTGGGGGSSDGGGSISPPDFSSQLDGFKTQLEADMQNRYTQLANELSQSNAGLMGDMNNLLTNMSQQYETRLVQQTEAFEAFKAQDMEDDNNMLSLFGEQTSALEAANKRAEEQTKLASSIQSQIDALKKSSSKPAAAPTAKPTGAIQSVSKPTASKAAPNVKTNSVVDYLKSTGKDSSFSSRSKMAAQLGIKNYTGTASQNTTLLNKLRGGAKPSVPAPKKPTPKPAPKTPAPKTPAPKTPAPKKPAPKPAPKKPSPKPAPKKPVVKKTQVRKATPVRKAAPKPAPKPAPKKTASGRPIPKGLVR